jgi:hypothetical protein
MKRLVVALIIIFALTSFLFAAEKVRSEQPISEVSPVINTMVNSNPTDDLYDLQFSFPVGVGGGEAGIETDGNYIYTTKWNGTVFYKYELDGTYVGEFACGAAASIRDLAFDGTYFYGGAATSTVYEMDFTNQTVISTITAPTDCRAIAYDPDADGFWANNWSTDVTLFDRNGNTVNSFAVGAMGSFYGLAWEDVLPGGPFLWGASQDGNGNDLIKMDIAAGGTQVETYDIANSGVTYAAGEICGGLFIADGLVAGKWTIGGIVQNVTIWGLELGDAAPPAAPGAPTDFAVVPNAGGANSATIAWTCPTVQVDGSALTDLDEMRVYRDGALIYTDSNPSIGGAGTYTDAAVPASGTYQYAVVGFNDAGEGIPATATVWVGEDVPASVENLTLAQTTPGALSGTLTWTNPTTGLNGGAFNNAIVGYHVTRSDNVTFEIAGSATSYVDATIPAAGVYSYEVVPYNIVGDGGSAVSNSVLIADPGLLIMEDFETFPPADWYTEGGSNWQGSATNNAGGTAPEAHFYWSPSTVGIQRLVTAELNTAGNTQLDLSFTHFLDDFSGGYALRVETTSDGSTWNTAWEINPAANIGPETVDLTVSTPDVGSATFRMAFVFDGDSFTLDHWYVDDVMLVAGTVVDPGTIEGTITLNGGTGNVADVEVAAGGVVVNPDASGNYTLTVAPGTYDVTASLAGYDPATETGVVVATGAATTGVDLTLEPSAVTLDPPSNVAVDDMTGTLSWTAPGAPSGFVDDFESYDDFAIAFQPWTLVDVDGSDTYGFNGTDFPHEYDPMAYIIFNPTTTTPPMTDMVAHSGDKFAACLASTTPDNDDWMITPQLNIESGDQVTFWAKSYTADYGLERFKVGVSTTGTAPADFTIISGAPYEEAPADDWAEFSFDLSAYAGQSVYVGIECVSSDAFVFMVDDVVVGPATDAGIAYNTNTAVMGHASREAGEPQHVVYTPATDNTRDLTGYNVYMGTTQVASNITDLYYVFDGLVNGQQYTVGVSAVYDEGESDVVEVTFTYNGDSANNGVVAATALLGNYPNPFNPSTEIFFSMKEAGKLSIEVYNIKGEKVKTLLNETVAAGNNSIEWNGTDDNNRAVSSGVYFYKMKSSTFESAKKMIMMK